jgi:hypothetical protein
MDPRILDALGLVMRALSFIVFVLTISDLIRAGRYNGPVIKAMTHVWVATAVVLASPLVGILEKVTDFLPDVNLYQVLTNWVWIAYGVLATAGIRLRAVLRSEEAKRWLKKHEGQP